MHKAAYGPASEDEGWGGGARVVLRGNALGRLKG